MSRRRVLAISPDLDRLKRIVGNLERAGAEVDALHTIDELPDPLLYRYVFCAPADSKGDLLDVLVSKAPERAHIAVIVEQAELADLTGILQDSRVNHVIVGDQLEKGVYVTATKLLSGDIFGIEKYLPEDAEVNYIRLRDFEGRGKAIDTILDFAKESGVRRQVRSAIGQVCEELLMNALYDAPVDESGKQVFAEIDPHNRTKSLSPRPVSIRYAATETQFAIAVRDRFGRLAKDTVLAYINKCLHSKSQIDRKAYGAGLGIYLVANAVSSYVVNVAFDIATEVICTFDRGQKSPLRLVGVFVHPGGADHLKGKAPRAESEDESGS